MNNIKLFVLIFFCINTNGKAKIHAQSNISILSEGSFYKVPITETGIYAIDIKYIESLSLQPKNINPNHIRIFSNNGGVLPEENSSYRINDLMEIPILLHGNDDNDWDSDEKIIFYAESASPILYNDKNERFEKSTNPYDRSNYIFIKIDNQKSKRLTTQTSITAERFQDYFYSIQRYENDDINILAGKNNYQGTGTEWYGEYFNMSRNKLVLDDKFNMNNLIGKEGRLTANFISRANGLTKFEISTNDNFLSTTINSSFLNSTETSYAQSGTIDEIIELSSNFQLDIRYSNINASTYEGWLNFVEIKSAFQLNENATQKIIIPSLNNKNEENIYLKTTDPFELFLDITDYENQKIINYKDGGYTFVGNKKNRLIAVNNDFKTLKKGRLIDNQNLHSINDTEMVIIYHPFFEAAAKELTKHRISYSNIKTKPVNIHHVYNEYSSGRLDPTAIRDFVRQLKSNNSELKYILLLGDGSYDYRSINPNNPNHNFIPVYETHSSLNPITGYPTDDYYALLDENEGTENNGKDLDIAIGRIPVTTSEEALDVINKIIYYDTQKSTLGNWRNNAFFVADDEDQNIHIRDCDLIAKKVDQADRDINVRKIYFDAFTQQSTPGGDRYYEATEKLNNAANNGALTIAYLGHGGAKGWAQERVLKKSDIDQWDNIDNMPLLVTATCSFAGYDEPTIVSAGEYSLLKGDGGAIGLFTTTRAVYSSSNKILTDAVFEVLFKKNNDGDFHTLGEALRIAKNKRGSSDNTRKFTLLGDPAQKLAIPDQNITTSSVTTNNIAIDTLSALQLVNISGYVSDEDKINTNFNGEIFITIFDKKSTNNTLENDKRSPKFFFEEYKNLLYKGKATVNNGSYEVSFVVPKDINYNYGVGKISYYAYDKKTGIDATGHKEIIIGGSADEIEDTEGPLITAYLNDSSFEPGDIVPRNSLLIVNLEDELGINVTGSSIGHDLIGILDNKSSEPILLNDYYTASTGNFKKGSLSYPLNNLEPGKHTLKITAWDVANNSNSVTIEFEVKETNEDLNIDIFPVPAKDIITVSFENDQELINYDATILIYSSSGELVYSKVTKSARTSINLEGNIFLPGLYFCKIKLSSSQLDNILESKFSQIIKI